MDLTSEDRLVQVQLRVLAGHEKKCYARALICAVENLRDNEWITDHEFRLAAQDGTFRSEALNYYDGDLIECICPPLPVPDAPIYEDGREE